MKGNTEVSKIWITGKSSYTIVLPKRFVMELGFNTSVHVIIEKIPDGFLIKKLEMEK